MYTKEQGTVLGAGSDPPDADTAPFDNINMCRSHPEVIFRSIYDSDKSYFSAGSETIRTECGVLYFVEGYPEVKAGACSFIHFEEGSLQKRRDCIAGMERVFRSIGRTYCRFYTAVYDPDLVRLATGRGYEIVEEVAYFQPALGTDAAGESGRFQIKPIRTEEGWSCKRDIHRECSAPADGKQVPADTWSEFERMKAETGYMEPYLLLRSGEPAAVFSIAPMERGLRIKNIVVRPGCRRIGAATAIVVHAAIKAGERGLDGVGLLAVRGGNGERVYKKMNMIDVGSQYEFCRELQVNGISNIE